MDSRLPELARLRERALRTRLHGHWTAVFRFLKTAYLRGLAPDWQRDLEGCGFCGGYSDVLYRAYRGGLRPERAHLPDPCHSPRLLVAAYAHGLEPARAQFAHLPDASLPAVLAAAYVAGYVPDPARDFEGRVLDLWRAWSDAVKHGAAIDFATVERLGDGAILRDAYAGGGLAAQLDHVAFVLEQQLLPQAYAAGLPFDYDTQVALVAAADAPAALRAAYARGAVPDSRHFDGLRGKDRDAAQLAAYDAGLRVRPEHGLPRTIRRRVLETARRQIWRAAALRAAFGRDVGEKIDGMASFI